MRTPQKQRTDLALAKEVTHIATSELTSAHRNWSKRTRSLLRYDRRLALGRPPPTRCFGDYYRGSRPGRSAEGDLDTGDSSWSRCSQNEPSFPAKIRRRVPRRPSC